METKLIEQYKTKLLELEQAEDEMNDFFERIVDSMLKTSKTESDFIEIKERLRVMPESASKFLLFRKIIFTEQDA